MRSSCGTGGSRSLTAVRISCWSSTRPGATSRRGDGVARARGTFGGSWGTNGLGPAQLFWMEHWPGDSLAVCHGVTTADAKQFVSIWDTQGNFGRRLSLARDGRVPRCLEALPGGGILALRWTPVPALDQEKGLSRQADVELFVVAGDGSLRGSLGLHPGAENFWHWERSPGGRHRFLHPQPALPEIAGVVSLGRTRACGAHGTLRTQGLPSRRVSGAHRAA